MRQFRSTIETTTSAGPAIDVGFRLADIVGESNALREVLRHAQTVAQTDSTVLIHGETGTGKELVAEAIHHWSARASGRVVKLNVAAIPSTLLESELFGHEKGAFTGAIARRLGRFELAHDGSLFLDEIGEMPMDVQPKLLRLLQERQYERLGGNHTLYSNARLIAATNRDLSTMVARRSFREDLYYRLNVFPIHLPPLRERREDIPALADRFVDRCSRKMKKTARAISTATMARLVSYAWPGNIRELQNVIERAVILAPENTRHDLDIQLPTPNEQRAELRVQPVVPSTLADVTRAHIVTTLEATGWVIGGPKGAAAKLGMKRSTLNFRIKKLGIKRSTSSIWADHASGDHRFAS